MPTHAEIVSLLEPTFRQDVLTLGDVPIPVADLRTDFRDFRRQERFLTNHTGVWPSVRVTVPDPSSTEIKIRAVPINVFGTAQRPYGREVEIQFMTNLESSLSGLPVDFIKPSEARQNFYDGLADVILGRIAWFAGKKSTGNPKVTVSGTPAGNQVQFTRGHFFSVGSVFGNFISAKHLSPGIYCFWRSSEATHTRMPLHDIRTDTTVTL